MKRRSEKKKTEDGPKSKRVEVHSCVVNQSDGTLVLLLLLREAPWLIIKTHSAEL